MRSFILASSAILLLIPGTSMILSCKKQKSTSTQTSENTPEASFVTEKQTYEDGDTVKLINTSKNASTFKWTLPNGDQVTSTDLTYITAPYDTPLQFLFKLDAFSEKGTKTSHFQNFVYLKEKQCKATFYTKTYFDTAIVSLDGAPYKKMVLSHSSSDNCDAANTLTYSLKMGIHTLEGYRLINPKGSSYLSHWNYTFELKPNVCNNIEAFHF